MAEEPSEGPVSPADYDRICHDERMCQLSAEVLRRWRKNPERSESKDYLPMAREWGADIRAEELGRIAARIQFN